MEYLESGDVSDEEFKQALQDTLDSISDAIDVKSEGYVKIINQLTSQAKIIKEEERRLENKRKSLESNVKRMKEILYQEMEATGKTKIKTPLFSIWVQNNPLSVDVIDESNIPNEYWKPQSPTLDKKLLLDDLKSGKSVPGATTKQTQGVRFR